MHSLLFRQVIDNHCSLHNHKRIRFERIKNQQEIGAVFVGKPPDSQSANGKQALTIDVKLPRRHNLARPGDTLRTLGSGCALRARTASGARWTDRSYRSGRTGWSDWTLRACVAFRPGWPCLTNWTLRPRGARQTRRPLRARVTFYPGRTCRPYWTYWTCRSDWTYRTRNTLWTNRASLSL